MYKFAFSLIELLVVVAIIAILAAIAVPAYKQYLVRTRIMQIYYLMEGWEVQVQAYWSVHGVFPNNTTQLPNIVLSAVPANLSAYVSYVNLAPNDSCGQSGGIAVGINSSAIGLNSSLYPSPSLYFNMYHTPGGLMTVCNYYENTNVDPDNSFPANCISQYVSSGVNPAWSAKVTQITNTQTCNN